MVNMAEQKFNNTKINHFPVSREDNIYIMGGQIIRVQYFKYFSYSDK